MGFTSHQSRVTNHVFIHLNCHSHYSFLRGVASPDEIIAAAVEQEMPAVGLTDTNGMHAAVSFYQKAKDAGIKPIVGVVLDVEFRFSSDGFRNSKFEIRNSASVPLTLLVMDMEGYSNLCQLTTLRHLGTTKLSSLPVSASPTSSAGRRQASPDTIEQSASSAETDGRPVTLQKLAEHSRSVIALCPLPGKSTDASTRRGTIHRALHESRVTSHQSLAISHFSQLKDIFTDRLYIEVQHLSPGDGRTVREAERLGRELGIPLVATNNVHFLKPEEHLHHRAVNAIRTGGLLTTVAPPEITTGEAWFKPAAEMQKCFPDHPKWLQATLEIADRCNLKLELKKMILPECAVPEGESAFSYLWKLSFDGARKRYKPLRPEVLSRLTHELEVIEHWHLAPYFLLVYDIVEEARRRGIPAAARGSAASSMVTYCLGISRVCPLRWGLYFERFLNEQRGDCPDIDIDICGARRDELLDYVYEHWGAEHVAMIGSFITMHARLAVREVAKVFGVPPGEVDRFTKRLPHRPVREILQAIRQLPECRDLPIDDEPWKTVLQVALRLDDAPRHMGIHPCGTVISARPLTRLTPLERATKGIVVTQYDMNAIEGLGLIKMDLLGQRGFTTMSLALDNIERSLQPVGAGLVYPEQSRRAPPASAPASVAPDGVTPCPKPRELDFDAIPENDPATCDVVAAGRTMGVFQIESPAMRGMLRMMNARTLEEMAIALAIIRPGAAEYGSKELFVKRLRGKEKLTYPHNSLEPILRDTRGVCIYQEQVMQIAQAVGKLSLAEADLVRRTSVKYSGQADYDRLRGKFDQAAGMMGLTKHQREESWQMVEKFAGFGFCKAHAATYADVAYRMAYLKTHHPAEFLAAMCSAGAGFYHVSAYVEEAKRWGIAVLLPSVNHSRMEYTAESAGNGQRALRVGLMQIKGLRIETITAILRAREEAGPFCSLKDFLRRVPVERDEIESLIKCGAFDEISDEINKGAHKMTRPEMLWQWNLLQASGKSAHPGAVRSPGMALPEKTETLFAETNAPDPVASALAEMQMPEYTLEQKLHYERKILEVCVSGHPLDFLPRNGEVWSDELPGLLGKRVTLCGWAITHRHVGTKNYRNMMFVTLEDQRGVYEVVLFPNVYDRYGGLVYETRTMRVTGRVEPDGQVNGEKLEALRK
ncbi:MAG TPA: DNA polymerase III subunit alpha [Candidatus Acidoferrum sp.]|nr:DNA polymerase III subunit alpha [Candidatus Acidoferrum sp.]